MKNILGEQVNYQLITQNSISAIQCQSIDRNFLLAEIVSLYRDRQIYFSNPGYQYLQKVSLDRSQSGIYLAPSSLKMECDRITSIFRDEDIPPKSIFVFEGFGKINNRFCFELKNFFFANLPYHLVLVDQLIDIPLELYSVIPIMIIELPNIKSIRKFLSYQFKSQNVDISGLANAFYGLPLGEISHLINQNQFTTFAINNYKSGKLVKQGLKIVPEPDVPRIGGLDALEEDLAKIKVLFSPEASKRGLRPPKSSLLWGLPGTGKSLIAKTMSYRLNASLVACDWNELLDVDISRSLSNLQYVLDIVDQIGNCVLFFDEFEKAFSGWNSGQNGGVLAKMAGKLLTWMQDHESPVIMLATINHLDMLPPELIRRFAYIWFFDSNLHNGAMYDIFQIHLEKHFPGLHQRFSDSLWRSIFTNYRGCSPAEIAGAVERTHHEIFFRDLHHTLSIDTLHQQLLLERTKFEPAINNKTTSNALAKILMQASFARPVRGSDKSRFARSQRTLFEPRVGDKKEIGFEEYRELYYEIMKCQKS